VDSRWSCLIDETVKHIPTIRIGKRTQTARLGSGSFGAGWTWYKAGAAAAAAPPVVGVETDPMLLRPHFVQNGESFPVSIAHWLQNMAVLSRQCGLPTGTGQGYDGNTKN